jgi:hypothetical protein
MYAALNQKVNSDQEDLCCVEIFVHWGVYESCKTWAEHNVGYRLQEEGESRVMFLCWYVHSFHLKSVLEWLGLGIEGTPEKYDHATVVILHHFDPVLDHYGLADTVHALGTELHDLSSDKNGVEKVLLLVTSWELVLELSDD